MNSQLASLPSVRSHYSDNSKGVMDHEEVRRNTLVEVICFFYNYLDKNEQKVFVGKQDKVYFLLCL